MAPRAELGNRLQALIDRPERLAEDERARARPSGCWRGPGRCRTQGPVIRSQVSRLELLLPTFNQPVMLALESDNATEVAIQRVGLLRRFRPAPGRAEARQVHRHRQARGFRDVRREITVSPGQCGQTIVIRCLEPI